MSFVNSAETWICGIYSFYLSPTPELMYYSV